MVNNPDVSGEWFEAATCQPPFGSPCLTPPGNQGPGSTPRQRARRSPLSGAITTPALGEASSIAKIALEAVALPRSFAQTTREGTRSRPFAARTSPLRSAGPSSISWTGNLPQPAARAAFAEHPSIAKIAFKAAALTRSFAKTAGKIVRSRPTASRANSSEGERHSVNGCTNGQNPNQEGSESGVGSHGYNVIGDTLEKQLFPNTT